jgi:ribosomal protein S18 acetylase RimI-like enzyme
MPTARELEPGEERLAAETLLELRPHWGDAETLARRIASQREDGYRVVASFDDGDDVAGAVAGFRLGRNTHRGSHLYVDDLVTRADRRGRGHAHAAMALVEEIARAAGCDELHLDSGVGPEREAAHRFYFRHGMRITSYHFTKPLR